jgi:ribosome-binding protein aMBF1 (putative translation factor)
MTQKKAWPDARTERKEKGAVALAIADLAIRHRERSGLTQGELAVRMGTYGPVISRLESGQHFPSLDTVRKLAAALGGRVKVDIVDIKPAKAPTRPKKRPAKKASSSRARS